MCVVILHDKLYKDNLYMFLLDIVVTSNIFFNIHTQKYTDSS